MIDIHNLDNLECLEDSIDELISLYEESGSNSKFKIRLLELDKTLSDSDIKKIIDAVNLATCDYWLLTCDY